MPFFHLPAREVSLAKPGEGPWVKVGVMGFRKGRNPETWRQKEAVLRKETA